MRFLERGDLPLAEDGSIIAYKMLKYGQHPKGGEYFVDCHSGKITQRVGSYVCVNENLVDLNRRNECSNGLHIARRGYLSGFGGDVCVLCKIDPEDVMVVPHNDPNKVRVKGYHILGVMSNEAMKLLKANKPMTGEEDALEMVYRAIKGDHIDRIERVQVNGQYGSNVQVTKLKHDKDRGRNAFTHTGSDLKKAAALDDETNITGAVDPRDINKRVTTEHKKLSGTKADVVITDGIDPLVDDVELRDAADFHDQMVANGGTNEGMGGPIKTGIAGKMNEAILDYNTAPNDQKQKAAQAIVALKRSAKKSWDKLGVNQKLADEIIGVAGGAQKPDKPAPVKASPKLKAGTKEKKAMVSPPTHALTKGKETKAEQARTLYDAWQKSGKPADFAKLADFKKKAKKGWAVLGFSATEITKIEAAL